MNLRLDKDITAFGGVLFYRSDREDIQSIKDLEGKISLQDFSTLSFRDSSPADFPFLLSTRLYPEWPMAKVRHTDIRLSEMVAAALIEMQPEDRAAKSAQYEGWTVPLNYQPVRDSLKILKTDPYRCGDCK